MPHRQKFRRIANSRRERLLAFSFLAVLAGAVLSFGGAEPASGFAAEAILLFLAACALWLHSPESPRFPWPGIALLSAVLALERCEIRSAEYPAHAELLLVAAAACAFFLATRVSETAGIRRLLCGGLLALCLFEALYGLVQYLTGWQQIGTYEKIAYTMMATGTYINPNHFAGLLEMALPLTFAWSLWEFERVAAAKLPDRSRDSRWPLLAAMLSGEITPVFALFLFTTLVLAAALLFSRSRMGIFSAFIGLGAVATGWIALRRKSRSATSGFAAAGLILLILAGVLAAGVWIGFGPVLTRFRDTESDLHSRLTLWKDAIELIRARPVWGTGPGSFEDAYTLVQTARSGKAHRSRAQRLPGVCGGVGYSRGCLAICARGRRARPRRSGILARPPVRRVHVPARLLRQRACSARAQRRRFQSAHPRKRVSLRHAARARLDALRESCIAPRTPKLTPLR